MKPLNSISKRRVAFSAIAPAFLCGAMALIAGCATEPDSHVVSAPPPPPPTVPATAVATVPVQTTTTTVAVPVTTASPAPGTVIVTQVPPTPQVEAVTARPSADHVWIPGYWSWRNNRYEWVGGHWEIPPYSGQTWIAPRWEQEKGAYRFYEGYWK